MRVAHLAAAGDEVGSGVASGGAAAARRRSRSERRVPFVASSDPGGFLTPATSFGLQVKTDVMHRRAAEWPGDPDAAIRLRMRIAVRNGDLAATSSTDPRRGGSLALLAMLGGPPPFGEVPGGVDQPDMGEGLRKVSEQPAGDRVVFLRQEANVVAHREQSLEELPGFGMPALEREVVGEPEGAGQECPLARAAGRRRPGRCGTGRRSRPSPGGARSPPPCPGRARRRPGGSRPAASSAGSRRGASSRRTGRRRRAPRHSHAGRRRHGSRRGRRASGRPGRRAGSAPHPSRRGRAPPRPSCVSG